VAANELHTVLRLRRDRVTWREVDGEIIVLDQAAATYFSVNESAVHLWRKLAEGATRAQLIDELVTHYEVDEPRAAADVDAFLVVCRESGLLDS
jgi:hypothetical protein